MKYILTALSVLVTFGSFAQEQKLLTLNEAVDLGVKNSKQLKISKAKIDEANAIVKQAEQKRLPDVSVSGSYLRLTNANLDMKTKGSGSGGSGSGSGAAEPHISQAMYGILNAGLPVFAGGRIKYGIESSKFLAKATELDAANDKDEIVQNTIEAYINMYKAKEAVRVVQENLSQAKQRVTEFSNLEKNGLLAKNDLLKAQLQASNIELALLDAQNNWQLATINLNILIGLPESTVLIPDSNLVKQDIAVKPLDDYLQSAYKNRKDLASVDLRKEAAETGVKSARGELFPSVQVTGGYIAADIPKVLTITNAANIGVGVSYSVSSLWKNKAKVKEAEARADQLNATQELMNDRVKLEVNKAYLDYLSSQKKVAVSSESIEQANENYRIVINKKNNNLATVTDEVDARFTKIQAEISYIVAKADAIVAYNELLKVSGQNQANK